MKVVVLLVLSLLVISPVSALSVEDAIKNDIGLCIACFPVWEDIFYHIPPIPYDETFMGL